MLLFIVMISGCDGNFQKKSVFGLEVEFGQGNVIPDKQTGQIAIPPFTSPIPEAVVLTVPDASGEEVGGKEPEPVIVIEEPILENEGQPEKETKPEETIPNTEAKTYAEASVEKNVKTAVISDNVYFVNIRRSPGYASKDDKKDVIVAVPRRETVTIISGPETADNLNWWYIRWNSYEGWMAETMRTGKTILIISN